MGEITGLLQRSRDGDAQARDALFTQVYDELRTLARRSLATHDTLTQLDAPSLVHEAYLRLTRRGDLPGDNRHMFFAYAARVMRSVIMDHLRERSAGKRDGGDRVTLTTSVEDSPLCGPPLVAIDSALRAFSQIDPRGHDIFEMHFFGGLPVQDIVAALDLSPATVKRELRKARAYLFRELGVAPEQ